MTIGTREVLTDTVGVYHVNIVPGAYSVTASKNGYKSQSTTVTTTSGQTSGQNFNLYLEISNLVGDVNNDKTINVFDALLTLQYAVGLIDHPLENNTKYLAIADVAPLNAGGKPNGDGQVNVFDALAILRHAVGLDGW